MKQQWAAEIFIKCYEVLVAWSPSNATFFDWFYIGRWPGRIAFVSGIHRKQLRKYQLVCGSLGSCCGRYVQDNMTEDQQRERENGNVTGELTTNAANAGILACNLSRIHVRVFLAAHHHSDFCLHIWISYHDGRVSDVWSLKLAAFFSICAYRRNVSHDA